MFSEYVSGSPSRARRAGAWALTWRVALSTIGSAMTAAASRTRSAQHLRIGLDKRGAAGGARERTARPSSLKTEPGTVRTESQAWASLVGRGLWDNDHVIIPPRAGSRCPSALVGPHPEEGRRGAARERATGRKAARSITVAEEDATSARRVRVAVNRCASMPPTQRCA